MRVMLVLEVDLNYSMIIVGLGFWGNLAYILSGTRRKLWVLNLQQFVNSRTIPI